MSAIWWILIGVAAALLIGLGGALSERRRPDQPRALSSMARKTSNTVADRETASGPRLEATSEAFIDWQRRFDNVFFNRTILDKERIVREVMKRHSIDLKQAYKIAVEEWEQELQNKL